MQQIYEITHSSQDETLSFDKCESFVVLIFCWVLPNAIRGAPVRGKREVGVNPTRSRHCNRKAEFLRSIGNSPK